MSRHVADQLSAYIDGALGVRDVERGLILVGEERSLVLDAREDVACKVERCLHLPRVAHELAGTDRAAIGGSIRFLPAAL